MGINEAIIRELIDQGKSPEEIAAFIVDVGQSSLDLKMLIAFALKVSSEKDKDTA